MPRPVVNEQTVRDALGEDAPLDSSRKFNDDDVLKVADVLYGAGSHGFREQRHINLILRRLTGPPSIKPEQVRALVQELFGSATAVLDGDMYFQLVELVADRVQYPAGERLAHVIKAQLGRCNIKVDFIPHFTASDTISALNACNEKNQNEFLGGYVSVEDIVTTIMEGHGFYRARGRPSGYHNRAIRDELCAIVKRHLVQKGALIDKISIDESTLFPSGYFAYCTLAFLEKKYPDEPSSD